MKNNITFLKRKLSLLLILLVFSVTYSQDFTNYNSDDGLIEGMIHSITKDHSDNFWFGSFADVDNDFNFGLASYDGTVFTIYSTDDGLADNKVFEIITDTNGNLWVGTDNGLSKFDGEIWTTFTVEDGLSGNVVVSLFQDSNDNLWFGCYNDATGGIGITKFDGTNWTTYNNIGYRSITQSNNGDIWVGGELGVHKFDGTNWVTYDVTDGLSTNNVFAIAFDNDENLWVGNNDDVGIDRFDGTTWTHFTTDDGLPHNRARAIIKDSENNMWFGTDWGISKYDGNTFTNYNYTDGLIYDQVRSLYLDNNDLWIGTFFGVSVLDLNSLGIEDHINLENIKIYPNPTSDKLFFENAENIIINKIIISNALGQKLLLYNSIENIDISNLTNGIYYISVEDNNGNISTFNVIKQ